MKRIIFIQGILTSDMLCNDFLQDLRDNGFEVIYFPLFYKLHQVDKEKELINKINEFLQNTKDSEYIILGHPFGGMLSYCLDKENYKKVSKIITVASPHTLPYRWFKSIIKELNYDPDCKSDHIKQSSVGSLFDTIVPFIFAKYKNSNKHRIFFGGHNRIFSRGFVEKIKKYL